MKSQMKTADKSGARVALLVGEDEVAKGTVTVRHLRGDAEQESVRRDEIVERVRSLING
jgi:histidyl-tRNA synthetase